MKKLLFNNQSFEAEQIIKSDSDIIGKDLNGIEVFIFRGISDFSLFTLGEGQTFDIPELTTEETLAKELANIKIDNMKKDVMMTNALQTIASLKVEVMNLKGGNV